MRETARKRTQEQLEDTRIQARCVCIRVSWCFNYSGDAPRAKTCGLPLATTTDQWQRRRYDRWLAVYLGKLPWLCNIKIIKDVYWQPWTLCSNSFSTSRKVRRFNCFTELYRRLILGQQTITIPVARGHARVASMGVECLG